MAIIVFTQCEMASGSSVGRGMTSSKRETAGMPDVILQEG